MLRATQLGTAPCRGPSAMCRMQCISIRFDAPRDENCSPAGALLGTCPVAPAQPPWLTSASARNGFIAADFHADVRGHCCTALPMHGGTWLRIDIVLFPTSSLAGTA